MNVPLLIKSRLRELDLDQRDLAHAASVTESYVSQLLAGKKSPPAADRTDIYQKMESFLKLPAGQLAKLADLQRIEELKKQLGDKPSPVLETVRDLVLRKCTPARQGPVREIFERQPLGELERLVMQKLLDVTKGVVRTELVDDDRIASVASMIRRTRRRVRVAPEQFLQSDIFSLSKESNLALFDSLLVSWDIELETFKMEIVLNEEVARVHRRSLEFVEREGGASTEQERGLKQFLGNPAMSGDLKGEELQYLQALRVAGRRPTPLFYYRELQNLRDPLSFTTQDPLT